jgi:hypothetical protein
MRSSTAATTRSQHKDLEQRAVARTRRTISASCKPEHFVEPAAASA